MSTPDTLGDTVRAHDKAVYNWLGTLSVDYGSISGKDRNGVPVLRVFAAPQQAFAKITDILTRSNWIAGDTATEMRANADAAWPTLPFPLVTLERGEPLPNVEEAGNVKTFRRIQLDRTTGRWMEHQWPRHYVTTYRATVWSIKRYTDSHVREWIYSQFGPIGVGQRERLIPVVHPTPWGTQLQRLRLEGSKDLSHLEGEDLRDIRTEFELTLRTLVFVPPVAAGPVIYGVGFDEAMLSLESGDTDPDSILVQHVGHTEDRSGNLFYFPYEGPEVALQWPVTGEGAEAVASTLAPGARGPGFKADSLSVSVAAADDSVELLERLNVLDTGSKVIVGVSFQYLGRTGTSALRAQSTSLDGLTITQRFLRSLPPGDSWNRVHLFMLSDANSTTLDIIGTGAAAELDVYDIDVRFEYDGTRTAFQASSVDGSDTVYQWANMGKTPYLVVGVLHPSSSPTAYTVTAQDDPVSPAWTQTQQLAPLTSIGFVFLVQPKVGAMAVRVPTALVIDSLYAQPYDGPYNGNAV